ncbi:MAG: BMP family ABC transporter substrate-binding protein [Chloroflexia bacterium]|nr:BMP family ABC transporter substrate-binding protein [Chloroflexia bacterium]
MSSEQPREVRVESRRVLLRRGVASLAVAGTAGLAVAPARWVAAQSTPAGGGEPLRVALVLHGTLGDRSFFDSAAAGIARAEAELGIEADILEAGLDRACWQPALADAADGDYDVIIVGTFEMNGFLTEIAPEYPDKRFILFDDVVDYASGCCGNVYSIQYRTSDAAYLAGYAAAKVSESKTVGTILGAEGGPILEFATGFEQGVAAGDPEVEVLQAVANTFADPARGKELALAQIQQGADIVFPIAGGTGIGALQAARDESIKAIGVDSDQAALFAESDPAQAAVIMTSVLKNVGQSLFLALQGTIDGTTEYGTAVVLGLADGAVDIAEDGPYQELVPEEVRLEVDELRQQIIDGDLNVESAFG